MGSEAATDLHRSNSRRRALVIVACGTVLLLAIRLVMLQGWLGPIRIGGGSMAESFHGPGFEIACRDCGYVFRLGIEYPPCDGRVVCPNCGFVDNPFDASSQLPGQRVMVDRWPLVFRDPRPWEPWAFRVHGDPERLAIKRVVAGNRGRVALRHGDLFVDGRIVRKNLPQLRQMRIPVYDDRFRCGRQSDPGPRWHGRHATSSWCPTAVGYRVDDVSSDRALSVDWLCYDQWVCWPYATPPRPRTASVPILDHYAYNYELSRGQLNRVHDIMLSCEIEIKGAGCLLVRLENLTDRFEYRWSLSDGRWQLSHNEEIVREGTDPTRPLRFQLEMAICDQRLLLAIDSKTVLRYPYSPADQDKDATDDLADRRSGPAIEAAGQRSDGAGLAIGARRLRVHVSGIRIDRDVHYLGPGGVDCWTADADLHRGEWFVLGDNVPISLDSRFRIVVRSQQMLGLVTERASWKALSW